MILSLVNGTIEAFRTVLTSRYSRVAWTYLDKANVLGLLSKLLSSQVQAVFVNDAGLLSRLATGNESDDTLRGSRAGDGPTILWPCCLCHTCEDVSTRLFRATFLL